MAKKLDYWSTRRSGEDKEFWRNKDRDEQRRRTTGLTSEEYWAKAKTQDNLCMVCHKPESVRRGERIFSLAVDHDHITGQLRDLLCSKCNRALGLLCEDKTIIQSLLDYISKWEVK